ERSYDEFVGHGRGLLVVGFGLRGIGGIGVSMDGAQLAECESFFPACLLLPGQVERLACVLPGLLAVSNQTTDLAEPRHPVGSMTRAHADTFSDRLLQQRAPLSNASLERIGIAEIRYDRTQPVPVAGGTAERQALVEYPDGVLQIPFGEVELAEAAMHNDRCDS